MEIKKIHYKKKELTGKLGQSSVNGLLNNSLSVNPLQLPNIMEVDFLRRKTFW